MAKSKVRPIPEGFHSLNPYLTVSPAAEAIEFYKKAFGAKERTRHPGPDGKVMHAELQFGDSILMLMDEFPGPMGSTRAPRSIGATTGGLCLYVPDVDAAFKQAVQAGATVLMPLADQFWGDRYGKLRDPFGHEWSLATHKEDLTPQELSKRGQEAMAQFAKN